MKILIFAPHPDDEIIGCFGLIHSAINQKSDIKVIIISSGGLTGSKEKREAESLQVLSKLGVEDIEFWNEEDGKIPQSGKIQLKYQNLVELYKPTLIAIPSTYEIHPDHRRVTRGVLSSISNEWQGEIYFYEVLIPIPQPNRIESIDGRLKLNLLALYKSQNKLYNYPKHVAGMMSMRSASIEAEYAEASISYFWDGRDQNFFDNLYLVTVIIRADNNALINNAFNSLLEQTYDNFEVFVIWHGDKTPPILPDGLIGKVIKGPGPKSDNLNLGVSLANGEFISFLDQDDYLLPDFLAILVAEINAVNNADIIYGNYLKVFCKIIDDKIEIIAKEECDDITYEPGKLLFGNFITLNSFICRTKLANRIGFSPDLEAYEDWDFLVRAELDGATFAHVSETVSEYRLYPELNEPLEVRSIHIRKGYIEFEDKIIEKFASLLSLNNIKNILINKKKDNEKINGLLKEINSINLEKSELSTKLKDLEISLSGIHVATELMDFNNIETNPVNNLLGQCLSKDPIISIIMPVCDPEYEHFIEAIDSIIQQTCSNWQLCIVNDASANEKIIDTLRLIEKKYSLDPRIKILHNETRKGIVKSSNLCIKNSDFSWILFMDHDDRIHPDTTLFLAAEILSDSNIDAIYTDSNTIDSNGVLLKTDKKPDWSPETLLHYNYINHLSCVRRSILDKIGLLRENFEGCQDWALWLDISRLINVKVCHIDIALYDWRAAKNSVAYDAGVKPYMLDSAISLLSYHMNKLGIDNHKAELSTKFSGFGHKWLQDLSPLTVIIPTNGDSKNILNLIDQLYRLDYPTLKVLILYNQFGGVGENDNALSNVIKNKEKIRLIKDYKPFNYARLNNIATSFCDTPLMLFLNHDINLLSADNICELVKYFQISEHVGAIGAKLMNFVDGNLNISSDGVWIDSTGKCFDIENNNVDYNISIPRNVSALASQCLLTNRIAFDLTGGFDERFINNYYNIDYCLNLRNLGYRIVQASDVELLNLYKKEHSTMFTNSFDALLNNESVLFTQKWKKYFSENLAAKKDIYLSGTRILNF